MAKKKEEEIDEEFIIASMNMTGPSALNKVHTVKQQETGEEQEIEKPLQTVPPKENRKKKNKGDYENLFIRQADITGRQEKTVYLREQYYDKIDKIIKLYKNPRLSVFSYIDAVLELHFEAYKQEIKEVHDKLYIAPYE